MKKFFIPALMLSVSLFAAPSQKDIDQNFNKCLDFDLKSDPYVTQEYCDKYWIPIATGGKADADTKEYLDDIYYTFDYSKAIDYSKYLHIPKKMYKVDEFGNRKAYTVNKSYYMFFVKISKLNSEKAIQDEFLKYNTAVLHDSGFYRIPRDPLDRLAYLKALSVAVDFHVSSGVLPSVINLSLADRTTKYGAINASLDSVGYYTKLYSYTSDGDYATISKRQKLLFAFISSKKLIISKTLVKGRGFWNGGATSERNIDNTGITLFNLAKSGDIESVKLLSLFAKGSFRDISNFLLSLDRTRNNFEYMNKHIR